MFIVRSGWGMTGRLGERSLGGGWGARGVCEARWVELVLHEACIRMNGMIRVKPTPTFFFHLNFLEVQILIPASKHEHGHGCTSISTANDFQPSGSSSFQPFPAIFRLQPSFQDGTVHVLTNSCHVQNRRLMIISSGRSRTSQGGNRLSESRTRSESDSRALWWGGRRLMMAD